MLLINNIFNWQPGIGSIHTCQKHILRLKTDDLWLKTDILITDFVYYGKKDYLMLKMDIFINAKTDVFCFQRAILEGKKNYFCKNISIIFKFSKHGHYNEIVTKIVSDNLIEIFTKIHFVIIFNQKSDYDYRMHCLNINHILIHYVTQVTHLLFFDCKIGDFKIAGLCLFTKKFVYLLSY